MREMKLRYLIELVSNIATTADKDANVLALAQKRIQQEMQGTEVRVGNLVRGLMRMNNIRGTEQQANYMAKLAHNALQAQQAIERVGKGLATTGKLGASLAAGAAAGYWAADRMLQKPMAFDTDLRRSVNTIFAERDVEGRRAGYSEANSFVMSAVRQVVGATREDAMAGIKGLIGSGAYDWEGTKSLLPTLLQARVASGADMNELVQLSDKLKTSLGLSDNDVKVAISKIMRGGEVGGFEIVDAAKWIGPMLPHFKGYKGLDAVEHMVTMMQQVRSTAGTNDEAANNLKNFLSKMSADETRKDFKKQGIDLDAEMAKGAVRGETPVDTYMAQLEKVMAKADPEGKARRLMEQADKSLTETERAQRYEEIKRIYQGSAMSSIIADLQEFGGYEGLRRTRAYGAQVLQEVKADSGQAVQRGYQFVAEGSEAHKTLAENEAANAATSVLEKLTPQLNKMYDGASGLAQKYPEMTTVVVGASGALTVFTAAVGAASVANTLLAGKLTGLLGGAGGLLGRGAAMAGAGVPAVGVAAAGAFAGYQMWRLGDAATQWWNASRREGVKLTPEAQARVAAMNKLQTPSAPPAAPTTLQRPVVKPVDPVSFLRLTAPKQGQQQLVSGKNTEIKVGQGRLDVRVHVTHEQTQVQTVVTQQPALVQVAAGATNPASYGGPR